MTTTMMMNIVVILMCDDVEYWLGDDYDDGLVKYKDIDNDVDSNAIVV